VKKKRNREDGGKRWVEKQSKYPCQQKGKKKGSNREEPGTQKINVKRKGARGKATCTFEIKREGRGEETSPSH